VETLEKARQRRGTGGILFLLHQKFCFFFIICFFFFTSFQKFSFVFVLRCVPSSFYFVPKVFCIF
jgi:hypothetical protein